MGSKYGRIPCIKTFVHIIAIILYVFIGAYAIVCAPLLARYHPLVVLSGSMEPTYKKGSILYYKVELGKNLKEGDVITYTAENNNYISHRIVGIENDEVTTKGDANKVADIKPVSFDNIKGKVARISIPYIGYYIQFVNNHLTVIIIVSVIILVSEFLLSNAETFGIKKKKSFLVEKRSEIEIL